MKEKTRVLVFANNKGGSGKTTSCANIGYSLVHNGKKVLLIDGDMQMNLSLSFFDEDKVMELASNGATIYEAIVGGKKLSDFVISTGYEGLDIVPSTTLMSGIEYDLYPKFSREQILKKALTDIKSSGEYDYILIDSPPTLGGWVMNILVAADSVIIPVEASPWGLFGLANMFEFIEQAKEINPELKLLGIAITKVDSRKNYYKQTAETLKEADVPVFDTIIRIDSEVEWAQDNSKPILVHKKSARSAQEYLTLSKEVIDKCQ